MSEKSLSQNFKSWNDVTIIPSPLFLVSRFCTPPEVKFDASGLSNHREGKSLSKYFFCYSYQHIVDIIYRANKKSVIHTSNCTLIRWCFIEASLGLPRKSSAIFGTFLKFSENVRKCLSGLRNNFGKSSEIFGKSLETPSSVCLYNKKNITR